MGHISFLYSCAKEDVLRRFFFFKHNSSQCLQFVEVYCCNYSDCMMIITVTKAIMKCLSIGKQMRRRTLL